MAARPAGTTRTGEVHGLVWRGLAGGARLFSGGVKNLLDTPDMASYPGIRVGEVGAPGRPPGYERERVYESQRKKTCQALRRCYGTARQFRPIRSTPPGRHPAQEDRVGKIDGAARARARVDALSPAVRDHERERGMEIKKSMKQVAVIVYGGGLNARWYINEFKRHGYAVLLCDGYCAIYG